MRIFKILFIISFIFVSCVSENGTLYQWRGEGRKGIFPDTGLLKEWPEEGPEELWSIEGLGNGFGSPTFTEDSFYITGETDSLSHLFCFDHEGVKQWETILGPEWMESYPGSRSAPTIAGDLVYTVTGAGDLYCVNKRSGEIVWSKNFANDASGIPTMHGFTEAPVIRDDLVFWTPGGKEINVTALNRYTGEQVWASPGFGERSGYNQGNLIELPGRDIFVTFSAYHLMGFDADTGELLWSQEQDNLTPPERVLGMGDTHTNSVIYENGYIYYCAGDGNCGVKLELSEDGSHISEVWRNRGFDGYMGGIVKYGDYIYGTGTARPEIRSINALTGELTDSIRLGVGAVIAADSMLYYYSQNGNLSLISFDKGKMNVESTFRIKKGTKEHFAHPVINRGILYQRHGNTLMAYRLT